jgi:FkbM family methyltransferase
VLVAALDATYTDRLDGSLPSVKLFERVVGLVRHSPLLEDAHWLWDRVRPVYEWALEATLARGGLERWINGTDLVRVSARQRDIREAYEPDVWRRVMQAARPGDVTLDIGACHGLYSVALARRSGPSGRVFAFEPDPVNADVVALHAALNGVSDRITLVRAAVGARAGEAFFQANRGSESALASDGMAGAIRVRMVTLDELFATGRVDLVKIDVEGFEEQVLRGGRALLSDRGRGPRHLFIEVHPFAWERANTTSASLLGLLAELGYRVETLDGERVDEIREYGEVVALR